MFGFLRKKKNSRIPDYNAKLISNFHKDHELLVKQIGEIKKALESSNTSKAKKGLRKLKMKILGHFMQEDIQLYWYLKDYYSDLESTSETIKMFEDSIKVIQKDVIKFLDYYSQDNIALDMTFNKRFDEIIEALATRIATEESSLYPLYMK